MPKPKVTPTRRVPPAENVLCLKVTLQHCRPPIWRRIVVPDNTTLGELHWIIQLAMGWTNSHLHAFKIGATSYGMMDEFAQEGSDMDDEDSVTLHDFQLRKGQKFTYEYDFGDGWMHTILIEKSEPATERHPRPACLAGRRACPPEDCGGVWGYQRVLQVLTKATTQDDREFREWVGDYDPEEFDLDQVNRRLRSPVVRFE